MSWFNDLRTTRRPLAGFIVIGLCWGIFAALVPAIKAQIGASDALYGLLVLVGSVGAVMAMWLAPLAERLAGRWALVLSCLTIAGGFCVAGQAQSPLVFSAALFVVAAGSGIADVIANAEISETEAARGRPLMNLNHALYALAFALAALAGGGLRAAGWGAGGITLVSATLVGLLCFAMKAPPRPAVTAHETQRDVSLPGALVWIGGLVVLAAFLSEAAVEGWSALHLERTLGAQPAASGAGPAIFGAMMAAGRLFGHGLGQRVSDLWLMNAACLLAAAGLALFAGAGSVWVAYLGLAAGGAGISVVVPLALALIGRSVRPAARLAAISRASVLGYGAFFFGPPAMGLISAAFGLRASFGMVASVLLIVVLVLLPLLSRQVTRTTA